MLPGSPGRALEILRQGEREGGSTPAVEHGDLRDEGARLESLLGEKGPEVALLCNGCAETIEHPLANTEYLFRKRLSQGAGEGRNAGEDVKR